MKRGEGFAALAVAVVIALAVLAALPRLVPGGGLSPRALRLEIGRLALESTRLSKALVECRRGRDGPDQGPGGVPELVPVPGPTP